MPKADGTPTQAELRAAAWTRRGEVVRRFHGEGECPPAVGSGAGLVDLEGETLLAPYTKFNGLGDWFVIGPEWMWQLSR